ncbi:MAG: hypothetical protein ACI8Z1_003962, partial [Candidatus Azotimanducaceae bacterium]
FRRECLGSFAFSLGKKVGGVPKIVRELQVDFSTDQVIPAFRALYPYCGAADNHLCAGLPSNLRDIFSCVVNPRVDVEPSNNNAEPVWMPGQIVTA